jgi:predicted nucleotidyltransferase
MLNLGDIKMKRFNAIESVSSAVLKGGLAAALFLKGSIARGDDDDYSDVDMYAAVFGQNREVFLARRIEYMQSYKPLLYWSEENFVGPQIVGVFNDGLHFDLYTVAADDIPQTGDIKILHDPTGLLKNYKTAPLSAAPKDIIRAAHEFTFVLLEFEAAYARGDLLWAIRLAYSLLADFSLITRHVHEPDNARLGLKGLHKAAPPALNKQLLKTMENATPSNILTHVKTLITLMEESINQLPPEIQNQINRDFYNFMKNKIFRL